ncbi:UNVERIFIED_ORG: hypothetical protein GGI57_004705 [Rhizobium aethiopicum]|uniref:DUF2169 family type VI secretion system accessory protein n=1 Tax=unclassified Rhizobium TaxID=2613769 RepID=UPI0008D9CE23|nr:MULTISPECIES: DUF2169 domain-containing protein [unclassified Rhizobium]OHV18819.1 hypothetical protein BBJ66_18790 [Rhizobium sp. RSm-3]RVU10465.1 DUF2169 domain-containing protein [Rhizobium sp. RMa-01]
MELINRLPFPAMAFRQFDANGDLDCVVSVRGTFVHRQGEALAIAAKQEDFQWEDAYDGDPHAGPLLRQTDLTPEKAGTDITFLGNAYAPNGAPARSWQVGLRVGELSKKLEVHGPRFWRPVIKEKWAGFSAREAKRVLADWQLSEAEPVSQVPMCWSKAYGGQIPATGDPETETPADVEARNPLGCGIVNLDMPSDHAPVAAPQITSPGETLNWREPAEPQGLGLVSPWWRSRQQHAGTYDDVWLNERHPLLPRDFDARFWQCAHPDLIAVPRLAGDEDYQLDDLHPRFARAAGRLPGMTLGVRCVGHDRDEWHVLSLDGVHFDWRDDERVMLTWRARFSLAEALGTELTLTRVRLNVEADAPGGVAA